MTEPVGERAHGGLQKGEVEALVVAGGGGVGGLALHAPRLEGGCPGGFNLCNSEDLLIDGADILIKSVEHLDL